MDWIVRRARRGSRRAFTRLWDAHAATLHGILLSMVPHGDAEDLLQEVALRAWRSMGDLEDDARVAPWFSTIARNVGRNALAARKTRKGMVPIRDDDEVSLAVKPARSRSSEADEILECIRSLPEPYREPLTLRLVLDLTGPQIAARTGLTPGSVRVNLCRGMKLLRERLQARGITP